MKIDAEDWQFFLLGDLNVDLTPSITSANAIKLQHILGIYGLWTIKTSDKTLLNNIVRFKKVKNDKKL